MPPRTLKTSPSLCLVAHPERVCANKRGRRQLKGRRGQGRESQGGTQSLGDGPSLIRHDSGPLGQSSARLADTCPLLFPDTADRGQASTSGPFFQSLQALLNSVQRNCLGCKEKPEARAVQSSSPHLTGSTSEPLRNVQSGTHNTAAGHVKTCRADRDLKAPPSLICCK